MTVTATDDDGRTRQATLDITVSAYTSVLAEGATGAFFDYDLLLANPTGSAITAAVTFFKEAGGSVVQQVPLPAQSRRTIRVDDIAGLESTTMSTAVRTIGAPILVERTMRWGQAGAPRYGAHSDKATAGAARTWYFAEGSQGFFFTYLLLANPADRANRATIDWLIEGAPAQRRVVSLAPNSRTTIDAGADAALVGRSFGIVVTFAEPAVAERAMYFGSPPDVLFKAGHDSAGVNAPATQWVLAEGATGPFFETFILLGNPEPGRGDGHAAVPDRSGVEVTRTVTVPGDGPAHRQHRGAESGGAGARERRGRDRRHRDAADRRRAGAVLARRAVGLVRSAQQLRRERAADALGPGRGPRRQPRGHSAGELSDLYPARQPGHDAGDRDGHLPARKRRPSHPDLCGRGRPPVQRRGGGGGQHGAGAGRRVLRRRHHVDGADRGRALAVRRRRHAGVRHRHERHGDAAALTRLRAPRQTAQTRQAPARPPVPRWCGASRRAQGSSAQEHFVGLVVRDWPTDNVDDETCVFQEAGPRRPWKQPVSC